MGEMNSLCVPTAWDQSCKSRHDCIGHELFVCQILHLVEAVIFAEKHQLACIRPAVTWGTYVPTTRLTEASLNAGFTAFGTVGAFDTLNETPEIQVPYEAIF